MEEITSWLLEGLIKYKKQGLPAFPPTEVDFDVDPLKEEIDDTIAYLERENFLIQDLEEGIIPRQAFADLIYDGHLEKLKERKESSKSLIKNKQFLQRALKEYYDQKPKKIEGKTRYFYRGWSLTKKAINKFNLKDASIPTDKYIQPPINM